MSLVKRREEVEVVAVVVVEVKAVVVVMGAGVVVEGVVVHALAISGSVKSSIL